jgi:hypothetical protein
MKKDSQCVYRRNITARSCNHCYGGEAICVTYSECASVALGIENAMRKRHIVICVLSGSTLFSQVISQTARFLKNKMLLNIKVSYFLYKCSLKQVYLHSNKSLFKTAKQVTRKR